MSFEYTTPAIIKCKLDEFMEMIDQFQDELSKKTHHIMRVGNNYPTILLHIAGKSILTTREILILCANGHPDGALSLSRNLYEQMMIVEFFELHRNDANFQEYIDDFFLSYAAQRNKCLRGIAEYIPEEESEKLKEEYEEIKQRANKDVKGEYWWTGFSNFSKLIKYIIQNQTDVNIRQLLVLHYARYKRACISLHASCMGNSNRIGKYTGFEVIDTSPTVYGHSTPLEFATISLITIIGFVCASFQIDSSKFLKPLNELAVYYQSQEKEDYERELVE